MKGQSVITCSEAKKTTKKSKTKILRLAVLYQKEFFRTNTKYTLNSNFGIGYIYTKDFAKLQYMFACLLEWYETWLFCADGKESLIKGRNSGLGICSSVYQVIRSFFVSKRADSSWKRAKELIAREKEQIVPITLLS